MKDKRILLIVSGGIAAYKTPELVRQIGKVGGQARVILTRAGTEFVTPMALGSVSGDTVYSDLFSLTEENHMGHIQLSRDADLVMVAPATADLMAKMAAGLADDLASTALLATDKPVMIAPAMNVRMWEHPATQQNLQTLQARGVRCIGPEEGDMACGEYGMGRMAEPDVITGAITRFFSQSSRLVGHHALITSGPTHEAIDPVRYIANRSSGKQGHAIARALAALGARTTLISGPTALPDPTGVDVVRVESARDMLAACENALPADIAVCAAAVADWRPQDTASGKMKKQSGEAPPAMPLTENPDILRTLAAGGNKRPGLLIGFAAETDNVIRNAQNKRESKGCDWIVANDVSRGTGTFGGDANTVHVVDAHGVDSWPCLSKPAVAEKLAERIASTLEVHT